MPDNTPSLSNGLGVKAVVTVFSQRQVSAIKNEHKYYMISLTVIKPPRRKLNRQLNYL